MKYQLLFLLLFYYGTNCFAQTFQLKVIGTTVAESKLIDSLKYNLNHPNVQAITDDINSMAERLSKIGYVENQVLENIRKNDSSFIAKFSLGQRINSIHIYLGKNREIIDLISSDKKKDTLTLPYSDIEPFLNNTLRKLEQNGFAFAKLKLVNIKKKNNSLFA